ncbi:elongation factor P [Candidatus Eisenbacteria bacterium]|uniref:Elongation factor P n=1 Tax=Eiseniibacteriota bacterium TaxID=2212470 RepID=A0ABV6YQ67_UNCEI
MATTNDLRNGMVIEMDGILYSVVEFQHVKPGKGGAFVRTRIKNLSAGRVIDKTFNAGEKVTVVRIDTVNMQYLYGSGEMYHFMNTETYEQIEIAAAMVEDISPLMKENTVVTVQMRDGQPLSIELPTFVELEVVETDPGVKGDTVSGGTKPAKLETGKVVQVPLFVEQGATIRVDTRTGDYVSRV